MAIDRTKELLECFQKIIIMKESPSPSGENLMIKLRNRHKRERFAVEDHKSPPGHHHHHLKEEGGGFEATSDSDMERSTPPTTFIAQATSIYNNICEAEELLMQRRMRGRGGEQDHHRHHHQSAAGITNISNSHHTFFTTKDDDDHHHQEMVQDGFQQVLDLCSMRVTSLQAVFDDLSMERKFKEKGWFGGLFKHYNNNPSPNPSQIDQHEAAIICFLNHRLSNLSRDYENLRDESLKSFKESSRIKLLRRRALASTRPSSLSSSLLPVSPSSASPFSPTNERVPKLNHNQQEENPPVSSSMEDNYSNQKFVEKFKVSPEQMQTLVLENDALVREYAEMRDALFTTQTSLGEISRLQATLQEQLLYQASQIDRLFDEAESTVETIRKANSQLDRATRTQSTSVRLFLWFMLFSTILILLLHFIAS